MKIAYGIVALLCLNIHNGFAQLNYGLIPQNCQVQWTNAGSLSATPTTARHLFNVTTYGAVPNDGQDDTNAIKSAINAAKVTGGVSIVYFPPGTYKISETIDLSRISSNENDLGYSNIIIQGAGSDQTLLEFSVSKDNNCFYIHGRALENTRIILTSNVLKDNNTLSGNFSYYNQGD
ncbi:MAG TPA: hypothetical protein ENN33_04865 [Ignavibacteria bacterium]|nr:hypothetical protein [Ignavibacteria bacterium]